MVSADHSPFGWGTAEASLDIPEKAGRGPGDSD
jgi:hypothetical protein